MPAPGGWVDVSQFTHRRNCITPLNRFVIFFVRLCLSFLQDALCWTSLKRVTIALWTTLTSAVLCEMFTILYTLQVQIFRESERSSRVSKFPKIIVLMWNTEQEFWHYADKRAVPEDGIFTAFWRAAISYTAETKESRISVTNRTCTVQWMALRQKQTCCISSARPMVLTSTTPSSRNGFSDVPN